MAEISWADKLLNFLGTGNTGVSFAQEYGYRGYANTVTNSGWSATPATSPTIPSAAAPTSTTQQGAVTSQQGSTSIPAATGTPSGSAQSGSVTNGTRRTKTDYWDGLPGPVGGTVEWQNGYWYVAVASNSQSPAGSAQAQQGSTATQGSTASQGATSNNQPSTGSQPAAGAQAGSSGASLPYNSYGSDSLVPSLNYAGYSSSPTYIYNPAATTSVSAGGGSSSPVIGVAGGGSSSSSMYASLITEYQQAQNDANAANEARYQQAVSQSIDRYNRGMALVSTLGQQQVTDINRAFDQRRGSVIQNAIGRGLFNTTALDAMQRGNEQNRQTALNSASSQRTAQILNTDAILSGDVLRLIERRQDVYPSWEGLTSLAAAYGQSQMSGAAGAALAANQNNYVNQQQQNSSGTAGLLSGVNSFLGSTGGGGNVGGAGGAGGFAMGGGGGAAGGGGSGGGGSSSGSGGSMAYESWMRDYRQFDSLYEDWTGGDQILRGRQNTNDRANPSDGLMSVGRPGTSSGGSAIPTAQGNSGATIGSAGPVVRGPNGFTYSPTAGSGDGLAEYIAFRGGAKDAAAGYALADEYYGTWD